MSKIKVGILCGGRSAEHEVSLQSAKNVCDAIDRDKYEPIIIGITKEGKWFVTNPDNFLTNGNDPKHITFKIVEAEMDMSQAVCGVDVVFPILHGPYGEDGTVQGLCKLAGVPCVGASVLGSAVGMDKDVMKRLLRDAGIPIGKFLTVRRGERVEFDEIVETFGLPLFVKPANMGSSVGVSKVNSEEEFVTALECAFQFDTKVIIEEIIVGREIECAILGNQNPKASELGEVRPLKDFYSYDAKYIDENGAELIIPVPVTAEEKERIQDMAIKVFKSLECSGLARVDVFLKDTGEVVVNEINTIPGFTKISMYPKLWEVSGIGYTELIDRLIQLAIEQHQSNLN